jgi:hypothetical protein
MDSDFSSMDSCFSINLIFTYSDDLLIGLKSVFTIMIALFTFTRVPPPNCTSDVIIISSDSLGPVPHELVIKQNKFDGDREYHTRI